MENHIKYLKESFIYNASLCSKELFHTNIWSWLIEKDIKFVEVFFDIDTKTIDKDTIKREAKNMDISFYTHNSELYVIENKIKSIPTMEQLNKYSENEKFKKGLLTGVVETLDLAYNSKWNFISYDSISKKILEKLPNSLLSNNEKVYVEEYCEVIKRISCLLNNDTGNVLKFSDNLNSIRLDDIANKFLMSKFRKYLVDNITFKEDDDIKIHIWNTFNHKKAGLGISYKYEGLYSFYIELEKDQYRHMISIKKADTALELWNLGCKHKWFDDNYNETKKVFGNFTKMIKEFNSYQPSTYTAVYQHYHIENISFEDLANNIKKDMDYLFDIIKESFL